MKYETTEDVPLFAKMGFRSLRELALATDDDLMKIPPFGVLDNEWKTIQPTLEMMRR